MGEAFFCVGSALRRMFVLRWLLFLTLRRRIFGRRVLRRRLRGTCLWRRPHVLRRWTFLRRWPDRLRFRPGRLGRWTFLRRWTGGVRFRPGRLWRRTLLRSRARRWRR